jgi:hypothetical protein
LHFTFWIEILYKRKSFSFRNINFILLVDWYVVLCWFYVIKKFKKHRIFVQLSILFELTDYFISNWKSRAIKICLLVFYIFFSSKTINAYTLYIQSELTCKVPTAVQCHRPQNGKNFFFNKSKKKCKKALLSRHANKQK